MKTSMKNMGLFFLMCVLAMAEPVFAQSCGHFVALKGGVFIKQDSSAEWKAAKLGGKVCEKNHLKTEKDGSAKVRMLDKNMLSITAGSELRFEEYRYQKKRRRVSLNLLYGLLRSAVKGSYDNKKDYFRVKTKTAVVGVRGTEFVTEFDAKTEQAQVTTLSGALEVRGFDGGVLGQPVQVLSGFSVIAKKAQAIQAPQKIPTERLRRLDRRTRIDEEASSRRGMRPRGMLPTDTQSQRSENPRQRFERMGNFDNDPANKRQRQIRNQRDRVGDQEQRRRQVPPPGDRTRPADRPSIKPPGPKPPPSSDGPPPPQN